MLFVSIYLGGDPTGFTPLFTTASADMLEDGDDRG